MDFFCNIRVRMTVNSDPPTADGIDITIPFFIKQQCPFAFDNGNGQNHVFMLGVGVPNNPLIAFSQRLVQLLYFLYDLVLSFHTNAVRIRSLFQATESHGEKREPQRSLLCGSLFSPWLSVAQPLNKRTLPSIRARRAKVKAS